ncbi:hypothetical protein SCHPADRAFT_902113 [Schizopora paradoxa]|uniref:Chromatin target of PRMT1 protein C-terminal domain-containing protein n=1 Tax=Schizopora paradoxa TaxID=27342 RepID=A0A0H2RVT3_9AGAM|nr:hypothetical protein SCHPADRAFT_902113 [Schizopora paradoxa]
MFVTLISGVIRYVLQRKREEDEEGDVEEDNEVSDGVTRTNALVLKGTPISRLPTGRIFGYAKYFDLEPVALEWIDDITCVLVFSSASACQEAQTALSSTARTNEQTMDLDDEGCLVAKPVPAPLWPPEERINRSLGVGEGLKGVIRMRVARVDDVKRRGARNQSEFYRKHGSEAGKDPANVVLRSERKFESNGMDEEEKRRKLDEELDDFLAHDDEQAETEVPDDPVLSERITTPDPDEDYNTTVLSRMRADAIDADVRSSVKRNKRIRTSLGDRLSSAPSKMRADRLGGAGRSLLQRTSLAHTDEDNLEYEGQGGREWNRRKDQNSQNGQSRRRRRGGRGRDTQGGGERRGGTERPSVTAQQLDDELDAFLNEK